MITEQQVSEKNKKFMEIALEIGFSRLGTTSPNPPVGAVIVKSSEIISTGGTSPCGSDHAEVCAIKNASGDISGAEMYVSLEPCCHYSKKTPPCTEAIKIAKISRIYIPVLDPNPAVAGKGIEILRKAGIDVVIMSEMSERAYDLIRHFRKYIFKKSPFVIHKSALTLDGKIASKTGDSRWISSEYSRYISHKLRSLVDAIIIGKNTMSMDNPALNIRLDSFSNEVNEYFAGSDFAIAGKGSFFLEMLLKSGEHDLSVSPLRVVIGLPDRIDFTKKIFRDENYLVFINEAKKEALLKEQENNNLKKLIESNKVSFVKGHSRIEEARSILSELYNRGKMIVMIEGGGTAAGSFLDAGEIDQFLYFIAPRIIGNGTDVIKTEGKESISESHILYDISAVMLKEDILYNAYSEATLGICEEVECLQD